MSGTWAKLSPRSYRDGGGGDDDENDDDWGAGGDCRELCDRGETACAYVPFFPHSHSTQYLDVVVSCCFARPC